VHVYPGKGYSITVRLDDEASQRSAPRVSLLDDEAKIVTSGLGPDRFRIAGTVEFNGTNLEIRDNRIRPLVKWCEPVLPGVCTEHAIPWAGLRPMMPPPQPIPSGRGACRLRVLPETWPIIDRSAPPPAWSTATQTQAR
jgi:D-amino-acid dehydrogenase